MRLSVSPHALNTHAQLLRNCFSPGGRAPACFEVVQGGAGCQLVIMKSSAETIEVESDRGIRENAILLHTRAGQHTVWLSFSEAWTFANKKSVLFNGAGFRVYLCPEVPNGAGGFVRGIARQLMRIEWEGKNVEKGEKWVFPALGAGHPHFQFDRCSIPFEGPTEPLFVGSRLELAAEFSADFQTPTGNKELDWFHKLHFPMHAPWHKEPYTHVLQEDGQVALPHAIQPTDTSELESWVQSVARYTKEQFCNYS